MDRAVADRMDRVSGMTVNMEEAGSDVKPALSTAGEVLGTIRRLWAVKGRQHAFALVMDARTAAAAAMLAYALAIYPVLVAADGHAYMASPTFGTPCPVVIYTFGLLLLIRTVPAWLLVIPALWSIIGSTAMFAFGVLPDAGLFVSGLVSVVFMFLDRRRTSAAARGRVQPDVNARVVPSVPSSRTRVQPVEEEA